VKICFQNLLFKFNLYRYKEAASLKELRVLVLDGNPLRSLDGLAAAAPRLEVGRCTLTPPATQLKGAWYPGGFNPCVYQVKEMVSEFAF
jgi:hypothetical protein